MGPKLNIVTIGHLFSYALTISWFQQIMRSTLNTKVFVITG